MCSTADDWSLSPAELSTSHWLRRSVVIGRIRHRSRNWPSRDVTATITANSSSSSRRSASSKQVEVLWWSSCARHVCTATSQARQAAINSDSVLPVGHWQTDRRTDAVHCRSATQQLGYWFRNTLKPLWSNPCCCVKYAPTMSWNWHA